MGGWECGASLHKCPGKLSLNVNYICPFCPVRPFSPVYPIWPVCHACCVCHVCYVCHVCPVYPLFLVCGISLKTLLPNVSQKTCLKSLNGCILHKQVGGCLIRHGICQMFYRSKVSNFLIFPSKRVNRKYFLAKNWEYRMFYSSIFCNLYFK